MNFFWKVFFSSVLISAATFSIGSFYLIDSQFSTALNREVTSAYEENDILCYSLKHEFENEYKFLDTGDSYSLVSEKLEELKKQAIWKVAQSVTINTSKGEIPFRLSSGGYQTIYNSSEVDIDNHMLKQLSADKRGYEIVQSDSKYYLHTAGPLTVQSEVLYLENFRDITFLFKNRSEQYHRFYYLIFIMILACGIVVFLVTRWLTRPLRKLSQATKQLSNGKLEKRVVIQSRDEMGKLSKDFNKMAAKLEQMVEELKEASRRQEDFIGNFAHELKTPLTSMIGYADMIRSKKMDQEQIVLSANYIFEEGNRLESLSKKLMDLIVLKKQKFTMRRVHAQDLFDEIRGIMLPVFKNENIEFVTSAEEAVLLIEPDFMKTVCINLLDNARKSMDNGGKAALSGKWLGDEYRIIVEDTGKGMESKELSKIAEAFYMVDKSRARAQGGAGLGLALCSEIIKLHEAEMDFQSSPGQGTCVTIRLKGAIRI